MPSAPKSSAARGKKAMDVNTDSNAPLSAGASLGHLAYMSIASASPMLPTPPVSQAPVARMEGVDDSAIADDNEEDKKEEGGDGAVTPLSEEKMLELFGPEPMDEDVFVAPSSSSSSSKPATSTIGMARRRPQLTYPVGFRPTNNSQYLKRRCSRTNLPSATNGFTGAHIPLTAETERSRSQSRSRPTRRRSIYDLLGTNPHFIGTSPSIMTPPASARNADRDTQMMPPPPLPSNSRRASGSRRPSGA
ncbi:hypothetical protein SCUCBS95973_004759 [Sporothrix curviconia]|uniref:Uncharacterized protein n=1 Tax=Sporothrix curviconia TaxID=1260050 RepID=A0ABP0BRZ7_9PEZI